VRDLYFGGDIESGIALSGLVADRMTQNRPVGDIIGDCVAGCEATLADPSKRYVAP
jgi:hypothetical protein